MIPCETHYQREISHVCLECKKVYCPECFTTPMVAGKCKAHSPVTLLSVTEEQRKARDELMTSRVQPKMKELTGLVSDLGARIHDLKAQQTQILAKLNSINYNANKMYDMRLAHFQSDFDGVMSKLLESLECKDIQPDQEVVAMSCYLDYAVFLMSDGKIMGWYPRIDPRPSVIHSGFTDGRKIKSLVAGFTGWWAIMENMDVYDPHQSPIFKSPGWKPVVKVVPYNIFYALIHVDGTVTIRKTEGPNTVFPSSWATFTTTHNHMEFTLKFPFEVKDMAISHMREMYFLSNDGSLCNQDLQKCLLGVVDISACHEIVTAVTVEGLVFTKGVNKVEGHTPRSIGRSGSVDAFGVVDLPKAVKVRSVSQSPTATFLLCEDGYVAGFGENANCEIYTPNVNVGEKVMVPTFVEELRGASQIGAMFGITVVKKSSGVFAKCDKSGLKRLF